MSRAREERIKQLKEVQPGWLEGEGEVPSAELWRVSEEFIYEIVQGGLPEPLIYLTPSGGLSLEWMQHGHFAPWAPSVEIRPDFRAELHTCNLDGPDSEDPDIFMIDDIRSSQAPQVTVTFVTQNGCIKRLIT